MSSSLWKPIKEEELIELEKERKVSVSQSMAVSLIKDFQKSGLEKAVIEVEEIKDKKGKRYYTNAGTCTRALGKAIQRLKLADKFQVWSSGSKIMIEPKPKGPRYSRIPIESERVKKS